MTMRLKTGERVEVYDRPFGSDRRRSRREGTATLARLRARPSNEAPLDLWYVRFGSDPADPVVERWVHPDDRA